MRKAVTFVALLAVFAVSSVSAWGDVGHQLTAYIAQNALNSNAASSVNSILNGQTLVDVATWADQVKKEPAYSWSPPLHYIDTQDWSCQYVPSRDCGDNVCVAGAITNYTTRVQEPSLGDKQVQEALKFLTHFVGDIHQPLHVGFTTDRGGNSITGTYNGKSENLHMIWDIALIEQRISTSFNGDQNQYGDYLIQQIAGQWAVNASMWAQCSSGQASCPVDWAEESASLACTNAYVDQAGNRIQSGFELGNPYFNFNSDVLDEQLAKGGVRLAAVLNRVLKGGSFEELPTNLIVVA